nr:EOG090X0E8U [Sida crystallina]
MEPVDDESSEYDESDGSEIQDEEESEESDQSESSIVANLPVLQSIMTKGKIATPALQQNDEEAEREAIKQELSTLSFEELQNLKQKLGSKKFNQTLTGKKNKSNKDVEEEDDEEKESKYKRANKNRPREMSSKSRKIEAKVAIQVPKVFHNDPRFDALCGEFHERKFHKNYEFVYKMKVKEVTKLKEELKEETNPKRVEKIKYLIQRMENQIRAEQKRKEEEEKQFEERQLQIDAMNQGISPYFASKTAQKEKTLKEKFNRLKDEGKLERYMAKRRKHNAQRDRKHMPTNLSK